MQMFQPDAQNPVPPSGPPAASKRSAAAAAAPPDVTSTAPAGSGSDAGSAPDAGTDQAAAAPAAAFIPPAESDGSTVYLQVSVLAMTCSFRMLLANPSSWHWRLLVFFKVGRSFQRKRLLSLCRFGT